MKKIFIIIVVIIPFLGMAQNPPNCDLLTIECCTVFDEDENLLELLASNANISEELYSYPGFILLNENGDTIAVETVNYFGIGEGGQPHYLEIVNSFELPFYGTLELYSNFYDSLHCVFPMAIEDGSTNVDEQFSQQEVVQIYPNPFVESIYIDLTQLSQATNCYIKVFQEDGKMAFSQELESDKTFVPISTLGKGNVYLIQVFDGEDRIVATEKLIKH